MKRAKRIFSEQKFVGITKAALGLLQTDAMVSGFEGTGEFSAYPCFEGVRLSGRKGHATVQCEFRQSNGSEVSFCPRTLLRRQVEGALKLGIDFLIGFEIEVVFLSREKLKDGTFSYAGKAMNEGGHCWSSARALQSDYVMDLLEEIVQNLDKIGIELQQFHPESCPGQYEFILPPLPPLTAVDTLIAAREIISLAAANHNLRATLVPKLTPSAPGTGAHVHISLARGSDQHWKSFYAGVLKELKAIAAFTYSQDASYERVIDGMWAGSTYICWGTQNRETPLRRIEGSHFEIKCIDGLANPYLALAAIIGAGTQGVKSAQPLQMKDLQGDPSQKSEEHLRGLGIRDRFPDSIEAALQNLELSEELRRVLGEAAVTTYCKVKRAEKELLDGMEEAQRRRWLIERY